MPYLKSIVGLALAGPLIVPAGHAQEGEDCPYPKVNFKNLGRIIEDLARISHRRNLDASDWG